MYAAVRRYDGVELGKVDELLQQVERGFVPIISQVPGFVAYYAFNAGGGTVVSVSIFEDQAGARESTVRATNWVKENLQPYVTSDPDILAGETVVQHAR